MWLYSLKFSKFFESIQYHEKAPFWGVLGFTPPNID